MHGTQQQCVRQLLGYLVDDNNRIEAVDELRFAVHQRNLIARLLIFRKRIFIRCGAKLKIDPKMLASESADVRFALFFGTIVAVSSELTSE